MIKFVKGTYVMNIQDGIVVETDMGLGFTILVPNGSPIYSNNIGSQILVYTELIVRENDIKLFGFHNLETLDFFNLLTTVSGIGPKGALSILSSMSVDELKKAIALGDSKTISKANGVGKKTADRLVLELKSKVGEMEETSDVIINSNEYKDERKEAISALIALGYTKTEALDAIAKIKEDSLTSEEYIKKALKYLF